MGECHVATWVCRVVCKSADGLPHEWPACGFSVCAWVWVGLSDSVRHCVIYTQGDVEHTNLTGWLLFEAGLQSTAGKKKEAN